MKSTATSVSLGDMRWAGSGITVKGRTTLQVYGQVLSCGALPHPTDKGLGLES